MARDFNGSSQYIRPSAELDITGTALTISAWVYIDTLTADKMIFGKGDATNYNFNYFLSITDLGFLPTHAYVVFGYIDGSLQHAAEGATALSTGQWYHLLGVYNGATQKIFIDNVEDASVAETGSMTQNNYAVEIGASPNGAGHALYHDGRIAEVAIWNAALNADEIKALKNGISPAFIRSGSLQAYYPLIGQDSPEPDWKAGNNGTVTGATAVDHIAITYPQQEMMRGYKPTAASNVTVAPNPATAAASVVAPTTVLGSLSLTPAVSTAAAVSVAPTTVLGSLTVAPNPATAAASSLAPTTVLGSMTVAPAVSTAATSVVAPTVVLGSLTLTPTASNAKAASVAPTVVQSSQTVAPSPATAAAVSVAPTVTLGGLTIAPTASSAATSVVAPTVVLSSITVAPAASDAKAATVAPTVAISDMIIAPTAASAVAASVAPTVVLGSLTITPTPAAAAVVGLGPTVLGDGPLVAPAPATAAAASVAPTVTLGSIVVTPTPRTSAAASVAPTIILGSVTVSPVARSAATATLIGAVLTGTVSISPTAVSAASMTLIGAVLIGVPHVPYEPEPPCEPFEEPAVRRVPKGWFARIGTVDVPITKASITWKLGVVNEFTVSVPARSIDRRDVYFADIAIWEDGKVIISGIVIETPQLELDLQGVSMLSIRCIDEIGRLTTTRAILSKHVQDEWVPQVITDLLLVADWELGDYSTMINIGAHTTVDLRNKDTLFAQVAETLKSIPKTTFRYSGKSLLTGRRKIDIGFFNTRTHYLYQGDNLVSLKLQHNTAKLVRVLEAYSDALPDRRITLADALDYPTINTEPDFVQFPIFYDSARGNYVMINQALARGCDMAKSFSMARPKNEGVASPAEIAAAGFGVWQRGVRFMQQSDDYINCTATGLFEEIPQVGDLMHVRGKAVETVWDTGTLTYREVVTFDLEEQMRITQVSYNFDHAVSAGYVAGRPVPYYQCTVELTTSAYPEEFDDAATIVDAVQTYKQLDSANAIKPSGALTYTQSAQTALATDPPDFACANGGKIFTFPVPAAPAGATKVIANVVNMSHPSAGYAVQQYASFPATPLIICANVAGGWGSANLTVTVQFIFS